MHPSNKDISYWLAAIHMPGIGPARIRRWLNTFNDIKTLLTASTSDLQAAGLAPKEMIALKNPNWKAVEKDLAWAEKADCHLIASSDPTYPILLKELNDAPLVLYVRGKPEVLSCPQLAIVGSRNPTAAGSALAEQFAHALAEAGLVITSGLALGVDAASHKGALASSSTTIAVFGTGVDQIYPVSHQSLAEEIAASGALVSEFPPGSPPTAKNFPRRNRIISGLSLGVLVIEAALRSGSLITARFASEQGREVFAVPGSIHNPLARGCHQLIREGAKLVEKAEEVLEELGPLWQAMAQDGASVKPVKDDSLPQEAQCLLKEIGYEVTAHDTLIVRSGLTASEVSSMLLSLELRGYVLRVPGGYVRSLADNT